MPSGVGATTLVNDPRASGVQFAPDPAAFFELTEKNAYTAFTFGTPGSGSTERKQIPQSGILSKLRVVFEGVLTTVDGTGAVTTTSRWPYGLMDRVTLAANAQNDLVSCNGSDLHALRAVRHPGFIPNDGVDLIPDGSGPAVAITEGANPVVLSWEIPIAIDDTSLIGALYAQSPSMNLDLAIREAVTADLLALTGTATAVITGTWYVQVTSFDIPLGGGDAPRLIVPDLSRLHGINAFEQPYSNTGEVQTNLIRVNGQLDRLLVQASKASPDGVATQQFLGWTADLDQVTAARIEYGASQRPLNYDPAHFLAMENLDNYADELPDKFMAFDFLAENAPRDVVLMPGVTDLKAVLTIGSGVTVAAGASVRVVQETLFA